MNVLNCETDTLIVVTSFGVFAYLTEERDDGSHYQAILLEQGLRLVEEGAMETQQSDQVLGLCYQLRDRESAVSLSLALFQEKRRQGIFGESRLLDLAREEIRRMDELVEEIIKRASSSERVTPVRLQSSCCDLVELVDEVLTDLNITHSVVVYGNPFRHHGLCYISNKNAIALALLHLLNLAIRYTKSSVLISVDLDLSLPLTLCVGVRYEGVALPFKAIAILEVIRECLERESGKLNYLTDRSPVNTLVARFPVTLGHPQLTR